jgi:para-aminobenzoate synthetase / 4-amino-4-deoxychorismate lyase
VTIPPRARLVRVPLKGGASRPDAERGVFSTMLVRDGAPVDLPAHLARLRDSVRELYGQRLPDGLEQDVRDAASPHGLARLRVLAFPGEDAVAVEVHPLGRLDSEPVVLVPAALPGGLGAHKWRDRSLVDELRHQLGAVPLLVDLDGHVLEAAHANVWIREGTTLVTPPLDGRILPGTVRARLLADPPAGRTAHVEPITLERVGAADELLLSSSLRGLHPAKLAGGRAARAATTLLSAVR